MAKKKTVGKMKIPYVNKEMKTIFHIKKRQFAIGSPKTEYKCIWNNKIEYDNIVKEYR